MVTKNTLNDIRVVHPSVSAMECVLLVCGMCAVNNTYQWIDFRRWRSEQCRSEHTVYGIVSSCALILRPTRHKSNLKTRVTA